ncbi:hypothetical protein SDC9_174693 [bioreactor metagenome]|uniref:Uncharacterized protein n=1 Tax=bioreactor metagenome TaxID=1076179 RepID=A0A645GUE2_9ZZZZ
MLLGCIDFGGELLVYLDLPVDGELCIAFADFLAELTLCISGDGGFDFPQEIGLAHGGNPLLPESVHLDLKVGCILFFTQVGSRSLEIVEHLAADFVPGLLLDDGDIDLQ